MISGIPGHSCQLDVPFCGVEAPIVQANHPGATSGDVASRDRIVRLEEQTVRRFGRSLDARDARRSALRCPENPIRCDEVDGKTNPIPALDQHRKPKHPRTVEFIHPPHPAAPKRGLGPGKWFVRRCYIICLSETSHMKTPHLTTSDTETERTKGASNTQRVVIGGRLPSQVSKNHQFQNFPWCWRMFATKCPTLTARGPEWTESTEKRNTGPGPRSQSQVRAQTGAGRC